MSDQSDKDQEPNLQQEKVGISVSAKWNKQHWIVAIIIFVVIVAGIVMTMISGDGETDSKNTSAIPTAPVTIKKVVPGDTLPPKAQQHIEDADKERAEEAATQKVSTMDSAPQIGGNKTPAAAATQDMPPASHQNGGNGNNGEHPGNPKLAENKFKAMQELQTRWKTPNALKLVVFDEDKPQSQRQVTQVATAPSSAQQRTTEYKGNHIPAGATYFAMLDKNINSDAGQGMVKATIRGGELDGAVVMGKADRKEKQLLGHLTQMTFKGQTIPIDAIAINAETTEDSIATAIDDHIISRWGALAGASILEGAATMAEKSGQTLASTYGAPITVATNFNSKQLIAGAVGNIGKRGATIAAAYFNTPPTLTADKGDEVGIIFATQTEDYLWLPKTNGLQD